MKFSLTVITALLVTACSARAVSPTGPAPTINTLQIVAAQKLLDVGSDHRLSAVATQTDGTSLTFTDNLTWSTSNNAILDITPDGVVTAVSAGDATVSLTWNGFTATLALQNQQTRSGVFVRGRVTDHATGLPVAAQTVWIGNATAVTDVYGNYSAWIDETSRVELTWLGLSPWTGATNFYPARGVRGDLLKDSMTCSSRYGRVVDAETGVPLGGVAIRLTWSSRATVTDADGNYRIDICPSANIGNTAWVQFDSDGYASTHDGIGRGRMTVARRDILLRRVLAR